MIGPTLMVALLFGTSGPTSDPVERFALVIGQNIGEEDVGTLRYADDDALSTHRLLVEAGVTSVLLADFDEETRAESDGAEPSGRPSRKAVLAAFDHLREKMKRARRRGKTVEFLLFYSGHGDVWRGEGYVVLEGGRLFRSELYARLLARSPADRNHVIIDACKSYFMVFEKGAGGHREPYTEHFAFRPEDGLLERTGFVLSTSSDRDSHEWGRLGAGVFSHQVRSALRGAADADQDGRVTYAELGAFLAAASEGIANPRLRPDFVVRPPGGRPADLEREILGWPKTQDRLLVDIPDLGHVFLEDADGRRIVDLNPGEDVALVLPPQRPLFLIRVSGDGEYRIASAGSAVLSALKELLRLQHPKGAVHLALRRMFARPFARKDVDRFAGAYADPTRQTARDAPAPTAAFGRRAWETAERVTPWVAVVAAVGAISLTISARVHRNAGEGASQARARDINDKIEAQNAGAIALSTLAGIAGAAWLGLVIFDAPGPPDRAGPALNVDGAGLTFGMEL